VVSFKAHRTLISKVETLNVQMAALDKNATYAVYCRSGNRSRQAVKVMHDAGFHNVYNLNGGVIDWANAGLTFGE